MPLFIETARDCAIALGTMHGVCLRRAAETGMFIVLDKRAKTRVGNSCFSGGALLVVLSGMTQAKERTLLSAAEYARIGRVVSQLCDRASYPALDRLPGSRLGLAY